MSCLGYLINPTTTLKVSVYAGVFSRLSEQLERRSISFWHELSDLQVDVLHGVKTKINEFHQKHEEPAPFSIHAVHSPVTSVSLTSNVQNYRRRHQCALISSVTIYMDRF